MRAPLLRLLLPLTAVAFLATGSTACSSTTDASTGGTTKDSGASLDTGSSLDTGEADTGEADTGEADTAPPADATADSPASDALDDTSTPDAPVDAPADVDTPPDADAPGATCGGIAGATCPTGFYCKTKDGACFVLDGIGTCEPIPSVCTKELAPVCGCDGKTYDNACLAAMASMSIAHEDACPAGGKICGGKIGATCSKDEYCDYPEGAMCGATDMTGNCQARPGACPLTYDPVCGCDGKTYGNACSARSAGTDVLKKGECP